MAATPYLTVNEAQEYFDDRLNSEAWDEATEVDKYRALVTATRAINNLRFVGQKATVNQENEFPRLGQTVVPKSIKEATCELALQLLDGVDPNLEIDGLSTQNDSYANVRSARDSSFAMPHIRNGIPSSEAWAKLLPYLPDPLNIRLTRR